MKFAPKRRSFWQYNKDNKYWILWLVAAVLGTAVIFEAQAAGLSFYGIGVFVVIYSFFNWKLQG